MEVEHIYEQTQRKAPKGRTKAQVPESPPPPEPPKPHPNKIRRCQSGQQSASIMSNFRELPRNWFKYLGTIATTRGRFSIGIEPHSKCGGTYRRVEVVLWGNYYDYEGLVKISDIIQWGNVVYCGKLDNRYIYDLQLPKMSALDEGVTLDLLSLIKEQAPLRSVEIRMLGEAIEIVQECKMLARKREKDGGSLAIIAEMNKEFDNLAVRMRAIRYNFGAQVALPMPGVFDVGYPLLGGLFDTLGVARVVLGEAQSVELSTPDAHTGSAVTGTHSKPELYFRIYMCYCTDLLNRIQEFLLFEYKVKVLQVVVDDKAQEAMLVLNTHIPNDKILTFLDKLLPWTVVKTKMLTGVIQSPYFT